MRDADVRVTFEDSTGARAPTTIAFRRDATKRGKVVRASRGGETGHATRLARVDDEDETKRTRVSRAYDRVTISSHRYLDSGIRERRRRDNSGRSARAARRCKCDSVTRGTTTTRAMRSMER